MSEAIRVEARFEGNGPPRPMDCSWRGRRYAIPSLDRRWEHEAEQHMLGMVTGAMGMSWHTSECKNLAPAANAGGRTQTCVDIASR